MCIRDRVNIATGGEDGISMAPADLGNPTSGAVLGSYSFNGALNNQTTLSAEAKITAIAAENMSGTSAATDLAFYTKPTGTGPGSAPSERIRIGSSGQLGIAGANYGTSGQVLTSGGASAAPSWAAVPPGGNTFTAVANGAIANNKAVKIDTDGKVSQIATTVQARSNPDGQSDVAPDGNRARHVHCVNCGTDMILMLWYDDVTNRAEMAVAHSATATGGYYFGTKY